MSTSRWILAISVLALAMFAAIALSPRAVRADRSPVTAPAALRVEEAKTSVATIDVAVAEVAADEDHLGPETVVASVESAPDTDGTVVRSTIVRTDFKYPLVRIDERVKPAAAPDKARIVSHQAMVADHLLVGIPAGQTREALTSVVTPLGARVRMFEPASGLALVAFDATRPEAFAEMREKLKAAGITAEPDYVVHAIDATYTPTDLSSSLWAMNSPGDIDINAPEAWAYFRAAAADPASLVGHSAGSRSVFIAVIDTGIGYGHPDLVGNYDPSHLGYDFYNNDTDPVDDEGHGTHVSGTIGAQANNGGVVGVCPEVTLIALKFLNNRGSGANSDAIRAISYATGLKNGTTTTPGIALRATNNSWGGGGFTETMKTAIMNADAAGVLFIAAAGNSGVNMETSKQYPACYDVANVISVGASDSADHAASFSNIGLTQVDLFAPGVAITSDFVTSIRKGRPSSYGYTSLSGTSMATPHVTGACALLAAYRPSLSAAQIKASILSVHLVTEMSASCVSGGRLDLYQAIRFAATLFTG